MTDTLKAQLTAAFEHFGPEMIQRGMRVFGPEAMKARGNISCCFVGFMGGEGRPGDFSKISADQRHASHGEVLSSAYEDYGDEGTRAVLQALTVEWLESACVPQRKVVPA